MRERTPKQSTQNLIIGARTTNPAAKNKQTKKNEQAKFESDITPNKKKKKNVSKQNITKVCNEIRTPMRAGARNLIQLSIDSVPVGEHDETEKQTKISSHNQQPSHQLVHHHHLVVD
jgi:hypothetical protein